MSYDPESWYYDYESGMTLEDVIDRWQKQRPGKTSRGGVMPRQKMRDDSMPLAVPLEVVWPYREYTWSRGHARRTAEEWDDLLESMREGWNADKPLLFAIGREGGAIVGEGNHRLAIARSLGFSEVPVRFVFQSGRVSKSTGMAW